MVSVLFCRFAVAVRSRFQSIFSIALGINVSGTAYVEPFEVIEYADGLSKSKKAHHAPIQFGANGQKTVIGI